MQPRARSRFAQPLTLPPVYSLVTLREVGDAFAHAKSIAADAGAGTLVHVGRFDVAEFAVVLEPEEPLATAWRSFYAGMAALGAALIYHAPPETAVGFDWPDTVRVGGGIVGGGRLAVPPGADPARLPDWMVFGAIIRTANMEDIEPGLRPQVTALDEEGFENVAAASLIESFARHLMFMTDTWQADGFAAMVRHYIERLPREPGLRREIDTNGDLLVRRPGTDAVERHDLVAALAAPAWLDPATGEPVT